MPGGLTLGFAMHLVNNFCRIFYKFVILWQIKSSNHNSRAAKHIAVYCPVCLLILTERSQHSKSAKTQAGNDFVTRDLWPQNKRLPGLIVEHFYDKFGNPFCNSFWDIVQIKNGQTHRQTEVKTRPPATAVGVVINNNNTWGLLVHVKCSDHNFMTEQHAATKDNWTIEHKLPVATKHMDWTSDRKEDVNGATCLAWSWCFWVTISDWFSDRKRIRKNITCPIIIKSFLLGNWPNW